MIMIAGVIKSYCHKKLHQEIALNYLYHRGSDCADFWKYF